MGENALGKSVCRFFKVEYLKDKVIPQIKVFFLHVDKHQSFLQFDIIVFWWVLPGMPKVPKITSLQYLSKISRKVRNKSDFFACR